jgi:hypothetical protein
MNPLYSPENSPLFGIYFLAYLLSGSGSALKLKIGCDVQQNCFARHNSTKSCSKFKKRGGLGWGRRDDPFPPKTTFFAVPFCNSCVSWIRANVR